MIRLAIDADAQQRMDIWQQNVPVMKTYWPQGNVGIQDWTLQTSKEQISNPRTYCLVSDIGVIDAYLDLMHETKTSDFVVNMMVRLSDAKGTQQQQAAFLRSRLRTNGRDLLMTWAQNALATGVEKCRAMYPNGGNASMLEMLGEMTAANGVRPEQSGPFLLYVVTPKELIAGLTGIK